MTETTYGRILWVKSSTTIFNWLRFLWHDMGNSPVFVYGISVKRGITGTFPSANGREQFVDSPILYIKGDYGDFPERIWEQWMDSPCEGGLRRSIPRTFHGSKGKSKRISQPANKKLSTHLPIQANCQLWTIDIDCFRSFYLLFYFYIAFNFC